MANNIYFNSRAKAMQSKLLSLETLVLLAKAKSVSEVSRILNENQMLLGIEAKSFEDFLQIVEREQNNFLLFLKNTTPNKDISKFFCLRFDYFNFECLFLEEKLKKTFKLLPSGMILPETLRKAIQTKDTKKELSPQMRNCLEVCEEFFSKGRGFGFLIDTAFKKAMFSEMLEASKCDKSLFEFFNAFVDLKNIELCFRFKDKKLFEETRILGGTIDNHFFEMLCTKSDEQIFVQAKNSPYFLPIKLILEARKENKPFSKFDFMLDCFGETFFEEFKFETTKNYAYLRYCFLRQNEITNLRIIFKGLLAKRSHKKICEDLRRFYAK